MMALGGKVITSVLSMLQDVGAGSREIEAPRYSRSYNFQLLASQTRKAILQLLQHGRTALQVGENELALRAAFKVGQSSGCPFHSVRVGLCTCGCGQLIAEAMLYMCCIKADASELLHLWLSSLRCMQFQ